MNKRKILKWIIALFVLMGILLVDPMNMIQKEVECASGGAVVYGMSERLLTEQENIQTFTAQQPYLQQLSIAFFLDDNSEKTGVIQMCLTDEAGNVIKQSDIPIAELSDHCYYDVPMDVRLKKGRQYQIRMQVRDCAVNIPGICYTVEESQHTVGNVSLIVNGQMVDGQAVMRYLYKGQLPFSNILCLWFFLVCIGFAIIEWVDMIQEKRQNRPRTGVC